MLLLHEIHSMGSWELMLLLHEIYAVKLTRESSLVVNFVCKLTYTDINKLSTFIPPPHPPPPKKKKKRFLSNSFLYSYNLNTVVLIKLEFILLKLVMICAP